MNTKNASPIQPIPMIWAQDPLVTPQDMSYMIIHIGKICERDQTVTDPGRNRSELKRRELQLDSDSLQIQKEFRGKSIPRASGEELLRLPFKNQNLLWRIYVGSNIRKLGMSKDIIKRNGGYKARDS